MEFISAYILLEQIKPIINEMDYRTFASFYCMVLEEWCKNKSLDIEEVIETIHKLVLVINETKGKY